MHNLYTDYGKVHSCSTHNHVNLAISKNDFERAFNAVKTALKKLHNNKGYQAKDLPEYDNLIEVTNNIFQQAVKKGIKDNAIPSKMRQALDEDVFVFSALKTHAQLFEVSRMLTDKNGYLKSFDKFSKDVDSVVKNYNQNYLQAEYNFATTTAQQAANWAKIEENEDQYYLQYRTARDDRVRYSHEELDGITLPPSDSFWDEFYPPNGWNCRCLAVEVRKDKYKKSNAKAAIKKGRIGTTKIGKNGKNKLAIFRFNPGKQKVIFPPNHPYQKLSGAETAIQKIK